MAKHSVTHIFTEAAEIHDADQREAFIQVSCGRDEGLAQEVRDLITSHFEAGSFMADTPAVSQTPGPVAAAFVPQRFGDYILLEEVGRGGMGVVYRAHQITLNRIVAVKVILSGQFASEEALCRFRGEAEAAAQLRHVNLVSVYAAGDYEGRPFYSMDFVAGATLADMTRDGPLPPKRAAGYLLKIAEAIHYAHERGILHRDLKPSNVLVDGNDEPRITDFGLAKRQQSDAVLTLTGQFFGSPNFMPPEQAGTGAPTGRWSDVYGLGAIFFHLLTGRPPFVAETFTELIEHVRHSDAISPRLLNPGVPDDAAAICLKCLQKEPSQRYPSARLAAIDLDHFLRDEPVHATAGTWTDFSQTFWASAEYASRYLGIADAIIPARQYLFYTCRSFLNFHLPSGAVNLCDLGCGDGAQAEQLLAWRATVRLTLIDGSGEMLQLAQRRLGSRENITFVRATFDEIIRGTVGLGRFDAIVSSFAIHHLAAAERISLFHRAIDSLAPGGWLLNIDVALPDEFDLAEWHFELWREWLVETDKQRPPGGSLRHVVEKTRNDPDNKFSALATQLSSLRAVGFLKVDCIYRNSIFSIYCGQKPVGG